MSGSSPTFVSQVRIRRKIVIVDKTQNEVIASILIFTHLRVLPATIRKLHNQAIRQAVPAKKNMKKKVVGLAICFYSIFGAIFIIIEIVSILFDKKIKNNKY